MRTFWSFRQNLSMYTTPWAPKLVIISSQLDADDNFDESCELKSILVIVGRGMVEVDVLSIVL